MKVRWSQTAFNELQDIFEFIACRNRSAAAVVAQRIQDRATMLGEFPLAGPVTDTVGVRALSVVTHPFVIFYAIDDGSGEVRILSVRHTAQDKTPAAE
jgi:plasmid stabilization system protein ParE